MRQHIPSVLIALVVAVLGYGLLKPAAPENQPLLGQAAPAFDLQTLDQKPYHFTGQIKRPLVLNFWASYCLPCRQEAPVLKALSEQHAGQVDFLGVVFFNDKPEQAETFLKEHQLKYPNVLDARSRVAIDYGIGQIPVTLVVSAEGKVVYRKLGAVGASELQAALQAVLN
ncbi:TlpA family protein disulfide reductase [Deinococcus roseus]|uniref:Cytochrome c biogenesis protein n=1 Tax=Deinococcus roseus TaxID=392414 RepID=A0ABQ2CZJ2_9DEIO|nr:TlpA disulfide reductase family protein [Deinococcus roseus]GGJ35909.1 cytochrome c biogenesis protein [Deinococcus roseus]